MDDQKSISLDQLIGLWILSHLTLRILGYLRLRQNQFKIMRMFVLDVLFALPYGLVLFFNPYQSDLLQSWFVLLFMLGSSFLQTYRHLVIKKDDEGSSKYSHDTTAFTVVFVTDASFIHDPYVE